MEGFVPIFSKMWWKYTLINCAMLQADITLNEYLYVRGEIRRPGQQVWIVDTQKEWQERRKVLGSVVR